MERLTERYRDYIRIKGCSTLYSREERKGAYLNNAVVRLAAYEDTWMEPDDIESLKIIPATNELLSFWPTAPLALSRSCLRWLRPGMRDGWWK